MRPEPIRAILTHLDLVGLQGAPRPPAVCLEVGLKLLVGGGYSSHGGFEFPMGSSFYDVFLQRGTSASSEWVKGEAAGIDLERS